jgi:transposase
VQQQRVEYWQQIEQVRVEDLVFIDEAGVNLAMTRLYARALKGQRAYSTRPNNRGKNQTMIGAITLTGVIATLTFEGGTNGNAFRAFVEQVLVPNLWQGVCVVMDNFSSHKVEGIAAAIEAVGATLIYLPPYSPDFNPIEQFWSKVKSIIRLIAPRTKQALDDAITTAFAQASLKDIKHWFAHCCYCTSLA